MKKFAVVMSTCLFVPGLAVAQAEPGEAGARACADIQAADERLACYDSAFNRPPNPPPVMATPADVFANASMAPVNRCDKGPPTSLLDSRWELETYTFDERKAASFCVRPYRPIYLMPYYTTRSNRTPSSPNPDNNVTEREDINRGELKYQISMKTKLLNDLFGSNGDLWLGYTQASHWQIFNGERSRPFRETNYEPDANLIFRIDSERNFFGWSPRLLGVGLVHHSNGRSNPFSRSWNRATAMLGLERKDWTLTLRPWWRVLEFGEDNNPDIADYMGRADMEIIHVAGDSQFALLLRHSLRGGERSHGALQFDWAFPIAPPLRGHVQVFHGYGESLIDYNHRAWYGGVGLSLVEWY